MAKVNLKEWRDIKEYEGRYSVSNTGDVMSLDYMHTKKNVIMKQSVDKDGYFRIQLCKNGIYKSFFVHRLVLEAFSYNYENKPTVNHINGIKSDNRIDNLQWATYSEQNQHAWDNGLKFMTEKKREASKKNIRICISKRDNEKNGSNNSINVDKYSLNNEYICTYSSISKASELTNISASCINNCINGKNYRKTAGGFIWRKHKIISND